MHGCVTPAPFDIGGHLFNQCLPLMLLFSMSCPSPSLLSTYRFIGAPQLCQALTQPHIPSLGRGTSHAFGSVWLVSGPSGKCSCPPSPFPLPSLPLSPAASHPFAFVGGEGVTLGSQCWVLTGAPQSPLHLAAVVSAPQPVPNMQPW